MIRIVFATTALLISTGQSFVLLPHQSKVINTQLYQSEFPLNFPQGAPNINEKRTKECAENFGKCSMKEIKQLRDELHKERIQSIVFGHGAVTTTNEELAKHRVFEEELDLQLKLYEDEIKTHDPTLFPEVEEPMIELPHLKDGTMAEKVKNEDKLFMLEQFLMEENIIEGIAFCCFIALVMMMPQIL